MTSFPSPMWIAFGLALVSWITANIFFFKIYNRVIQELPLNQHPFPAPHNPRFCYQLWKQHRLRFPDSALTTQWLAAYFICSFGLIAGFTMLLKSQ